MRSAPTITHCILPCCINAAAALSANTANQILAMAEQVSLPLAARIAQLARAEALRWVGPAVRVEALITDRQGAIVGRADGW